MKFDLSKDEMKEIEMVENDSNICQYLKNQHKVKFNVGDILIRKMKNWSDKWVAETINSDTGMIKRYVYVYENQYGVGFVKSLKTSTATLGKETICIADIDYEADKFEVDPEYADQVLFGDDQAFNIKELHKRAKEKKSRVKEINEKSYVKYSKLSELNEFFSKLSPGTTFYQGYDLLGYHITDHKIVSLKRKYISALSIELRDHLNYLIQLDHIEVDDKKIYVIEVADTYGNIFELSADFGNKALYMNKPVTMQDQI